MYVCTYNNLNVHTCTVHVKLMFQHCSYIFVQVLERSIQLQDSDAIMKSFIDLADHCPKFLRSQIENIIELMLKVRGVARIRRGEVDLEGRRERGKGARERYIGERGREVDWERKG